MIFNIKANALVHVINIALRVNYVIALYIVSIQTFRRYYVYLNEIHLHYLLTLIDHSKILQNCYNIDIVCSWDNLLPVKFSYKSMFISCVF